MVLGIDWLLGLVRFYSDLAKYLFVGLNLPSSFMFLWLCKQPAA